MSAAADTTTWEQKRGKLARLSQKLPPGAPELEELRAELKAQRLEEHVAKAIASAPPLSEDQLARVAAILRTSGRVSHD